MWYKFVYIGAIIVAPVLPVMWRNAWSDHLLIQALWWQPTKANTLIQAQLCLVQASPDRSFHRVSPPCPAPPLVQYCLDTYPIISSSTINNFLLKRCHLWVFLTMIQLWRALLSLKIDGFVILEQLLFYVTMGFFKILFLHICWKKSRRSGLH